MMKVYKRCGISGANGVKCDILEYVERNTLRWFSYLEGKKSEVFMKKVYICK